MRHLTVVLGLCALAHAQFGGGFFDQMFNGGQQGHERGQSQNNPSDASFYQLHHDEAVCDKYLCPDTLACVHFPHHCPCKWAAQEDKFELADGQRICLSRGGYKAGEAARKVELARKGLL